MYSVNNQQNYASYTLEKVASLPFECPDIQRSVDSDVVNEICAYQMGRLNTCGSFMFLGPLVVGNIGGTMFLLDGQHRFEAMRRIYGHMPSYKVSVLYVQITSTFTLCDAFALLNKNTPVPEYVINNMLESSKRAVFEEFIKLFKDKYKLYLSKNTRPQRPNVNVNHVADAIDKGGLLAALPCAESIMQYIQYMNVHVWKHMDPNNVGKCVAKAGTSEKILYMSCDRDNCWIKNRQYLEAFRQFQQQYKCQTTQPCAKRARKSIPSSVRAQLWGKYFLETTGNCKVCGCVLHNGSMECGHIVSVANGGSDAITNLMPICGKCNGSMGSTNMDVFLKVYYNSALTLNDKGALVVTPIA